MMIIPIKVTFELIFLQAEVNKNPVDKMNAIGNLLLLIQLCLISVYAMPTAPASGSTGAKPAEAAKETLPIFDPVGAFGKLFRVGNNGLYVTARGAKKVMDDTITDGAKVILDPFAQFGKAFGLDSVIRDMPIKTLDGIFKTTDSVAETVHTGIDGLAQGVEKVGGVTAPLINAPLRVASGVAGATGNAIASLTNPENMKNLLNVDLLNFKG